MKKGILPLFLFLLFFQFSNAQGSDNAGNYGSAWSGNGGSGFGDWSFNTTGNSSQSGSFLGQTGFGNASDANGNGDGGGDGDINTSGKAWGLYANSGTLSEAFRFFTTDMDTDDRLSISMDIGFIDNGSTVGFAVQTDAGNNLLEIFFIGGMSAFIISDASGNTNSTIGFTDEGVNIQIEITGVSAGTYSHSTTISALEGGGSYNKTGNFITSGQVGKVRLFNANAGNNTSNNLYFNSINHEIDALPIELSRFHAFANANQVDLHWQTDTEINNSHFNVQRSVNAREFETIGRVEGLGSSNSSANYSFIDQQPIRGKNYYRLQQVDFDGKTSLSNVIVIEFNTPTNVQYFPNPIQDELIVEWIDQSESGILEIVDTQGRILHASTINEQLFINTQNWPKGIYFLRIKNERELLWVEKVVK